MRREAWVARGEKRGVISEELRTSSSGCDDRSRPAPPGILPTKLYCKNANVDSENTARLGELPGAAVTFRAIDQFKGEYTSDAQQKLREMIEKKAAAQAHGWWVVGSGVWGVVGEAERERRCPPPTLHTHQRTSALCPAASRRVALWSDP